MLRVRTTRGHRSHAINDDVLTAYLNGLKIQGSRHTVKTVHDLPFEVGQSIRSCTCRVRVDRKTGITKSTITIRFYDRRIPMLRYATFGVAVRAAERS